MKSDIPEYVGTVKPPKRQRWDSVMDRPKTGKPPLVETAQKWHKALYGDGSMLDGEFHEIPDYRAKVVRLEHGQIEVSITPTNKSNVLNARMGFNPLLDCGTKLRTVEDQARRDIENRARSAKRARQNVRHLVKSIFADHMLTFSYRENMIDREKLKADWKEFVRLFRHRYPDWQYLAVPEEQERGSLHIHVAVASKQDIKWLLRCWLLAIGQPPEEVAEWLYSGVKLGERSFGAVNVEPPKKRWGGEHRQWKRDKLSGYLTKYIGKEFEESDKSAKKYWHSRNVVKPEITRFWLKAKTYDEAVREAHDLVYYSGVDSISMWGDQRAGVVWITGETRRENIGLRSSERPDFDLLAD